MKESWAGTLEESMGNDNRSRRKFNEVEQEFLEEALLLSSFNNLSGGPKGSSSPERVLKELKSKKKSFRIGAKKRSKAAK